MAPGLNTTDPEAAHSHGQNPQYLIESITRNKIYNNLYWKEHCFGLSAETLIDEAVKLKYVSGTFGPMANPSPFICLVLKMLQICPSEDIILSLVKDETYAYVRCLAVFYLRLTGRPVEVYQHLEPLYEDSRKIRVRVGTASGEAGWELITVDAFVDQCLNEDHVLNMQLPRLAKRLHLEKGGQLKRRRGELDKDERVKEVIAHNDKMAEMVRNGGKKKKTESTKNKGTGLFKEEKGGENKVEEKKEITLKEGTDEWWNEERSKLGLSALKK